MPQGSLSLPEPRVARQEFSALRPFARPEMELREIVRILRRRKVVVLAAFVLGILLATVSMLVVRPEYTATVTIETNRENNGSLGLADLSGMAAGLGDPEGQNMDLLTQQSVILSDNTALRVIEQLKLESSAPFAVPASGGESVLEREYSLPLEGAPHRRERALKIFKSGLRVNLIKGTRLMTVAYTDSDPKRAAAIANEVVDSYMSGSTEARFLASSKTSAWLTGQLADLKRRVEQSQEKVDAFARKSGLTGMTPVVQGMGAERSPTHFSSLAGAGTVGASSTGDVALERLIELNRNLTNAVVSRIAKEAIYKMTETHDPEIVLGLGSSGLGSSSWMGADATDVALLQHLRQQQAQVNVQEAAAATKYGAKSPVMLQLENERASLELQIHAELDRIRLRARNDVGVAMLAEDGIRRQIETQEQVVNRVTERADQLVLLQEEAQSSRAIYEDLYTKLEEASVTAGIKASTVTLVDPARAPAHPSYPKKRAAIALGAVAGFALGLAAAFTWEYFDDSIALPEQAEQISSLPVIGAIPDFSQRQSVAARYSVSSRQPVLPHSESSAWLMRAPHSQIAESYRALRTALLLSRAERPPRVLVLMSGSPEEGKSTTCLNIAAAFALQGDRVLYLDADLRRARAHHFFACSNERGLSNCLAGGLSFAEALHVHPAASSLFLLPAGSPPPNPSELLGSKAFADLLTELKGEFEYIFIDSPPVLLVTDAQLIASHVDGCVLVVRANKTSKHGLARSMALMRNVRAPQLGIVLNAWNASSTAEEGYRAGGGYYADDV